jgi:transglutaminase-like putative cysteine protease
MLVVSALTVIALAVRLNGRRWGPWPGRLLATLIVLMIVQRVFAATGGVLAGRVVIAQSFALIVLLIFLRRVERGSTYIGCIVGLFTLVAAGLTRSDLAYILCLWGFLLTLPGLLTFGHVHEAMRVDDLAFTFADAGGLGRSRLMANLRYFASLGLVALAGYATYLAVPRIAILPLEWSRFGSPANSLFEKLEVGGGPVPRGGRPFAEVESPEPVYLLAQLFDRFDGRRWSRSPSTDKARLNREGRFELQSGLDTCRREQTAARRALIRLFWDLPDLLLLPQGTRGLEIGSWHLLGDPPFHLRAWAASRFTTYAATYEPPASTTALGPGHAAAWPPARPADLGLPPALDERIGPLAAAATQGLAEPAAKVEALSRWLGRTYVYDSTATTPKGADPLVQFLFESKRGYCEHFATALAVMCRIVGVPSMLATGYAPGDPAKDGRGYLVRPRDAHAWTLAFIDRHGWVPVDATEHIRSISRWDEAADWIAGDPASLTAQPAWQLKLAEIADRTFFTSRNFIKAYGWRIVEGGAASSGCAGLVFLVWRLRKRRGPGELAQPLAADQTGSAALTTTGEVVPGPQSGRARMRPHERPTGPALRDTTPAQETRSDADGIGTALGYVHEWDERAKGLSARFDALCLLLAERGARERHPSETPIEYARTLADSDELRVLLLEVALQLTRLLLGPAPGSGGLEEDVSRGIGRIEAALRDRGP